MPDYTNDPRFHEMQFLARFEHERFVRVQFPAGGLNHQQAKERQMVLTLLHSGLLNGPDVRARKYVTDGFSTPVYSNMEHQDRLEKGRLIESLLAGQEVALEMGHSGRVRLYELQDQLKATRLRERFGILFDGRHVERDLAMAILNSRPEAPVSLAYLDMNGLKAFNEDGDHATGNIAIQTFFQAVEKAVSGAGDAYREGGDEVVVIMPGTPLVEARRRMRAALESLAGEAISVNGESRKLSSACGLVTVSSPQSKPHEEKVRADHLQKEAKAASKLADGRRCSALRVEDEAKPELIGT